MTLEPQRAAAGGAGLPTADPAAGRWWAAGLWCGLLLVLLRLAVLAAMEGASHGVDAERLRLRLATAVPAVLLTGLLVGLVSGAVIALTRQRWTARLLCGGALARLTAVAVCAALIWALLTGQLSDDVSRRVGFGTSRGVFTSVVLAGVALGVAAWLSAHVTSPDATSTSARRPGTRDALVPLAMAGVLLLLARSQSGLDGRMTVRAVVHDLVAEADAWQWLAHRAEAPPHVAVLCPSVDFQVRGGDKPSLVLPPPARVAYTLDADAGPLWLTAAAGVDQSVILEHGAALAGSSVRFEVQVQSPGDAAPRTVFDTRVPLVSTGRMPGSEWQPVGAAGLSEVRGPQGLALSGGDVLTLSTSLVGADGQPRETSLALAAGFGELTLERRTEAPRQPSSPSAPNVIVIVMDTQRADRLSAYGYERPTSPNLERLAARGTLFEQAHATSSWTWPSTASLLTGLLPEEHGVLDSSSCYLADGLATLPEAFQAAGWTTAGWSANVLIVPDKNFDQGFEFFDHPAGTTRRSPTFMPAVLEWIEATAGTRFFLYLQLLDAHAPLIPLPAARQQFAADVPADFSPYEINVHRTELQACFTAAGGRPDTDACVSPEEQAWVSDLYDACTASGDHWLGAILDQLEALDLDGETLIVFTSDHGEELYDHGLVTHGQSLHRELVQVPLVLAGPGVPAGQRRRAPISNRHLAATLAGLTGVPFDAPPDAFDLLSDQLPALARRDPLLFSTREGWWDGAVHVPVWGLRQGARVVHWAPKGAREQVRLYDLDADPTEQDDLAPRLPAEAERTRRAIEDLVETLRARRRAPELPAGQATLELLEQIGYLDSGDG